MGDGYLPLIRLFNPGSRPLDIFVSPDGWSFGLFILTEKGAIWKWELQNLFIFYITIAHAARFSKHEQGVTFWVSHPLSGYYVGASLSIEVCRIGLYGVLDNVGNIVWFTPLGFSAVCSMEKKRTLSFTLVRVLDLFCPSVPFNLSFTQESAISTTFFVMFWKLALDFLLVSVPLWNGGK